MTCVEKYFQTYDAAFQSFIKFVHKRFKRSDEAIRNTHSSEYEKTHAQVCHQIKVDIDRGLWRMKCLFPENNYEVYCHLLQTLYYRFFLILWANSDAAESGMQYYYQGITDPMEIYFVAFLDRSKIDKLQYCGSCTMHCQLQCRNCLRT